MNLTEQIDYDRRMRKKEVKILKELRKYYRKGLRGRLPEKVFYRISGEEKELFYRWLAGRREKMNYLVAMSTYEMPPQQGEGISEEVTDLENILNFVKRKRTKETKTLKDEQPKTEKEKTIYQ